MSVQTYEQVPYQSKPYEYATADRLAVIGGLFGMPVTPPSQARVLEIGCAGGGNLIPRALVHPDATFYGIDPAERHVREAHQILTALDVDNVTIDKRGVENLSEQDGTFDYIIAHGVYSWIPESLRQALLAAVRDRLAPNGIAYISYNVLPGWHMRRMVRDAMLFHIEPFEDPQERITQARAMLDFMATNAPGATGPWKRLLQSERDMLSQYGDGYVFHDHLSPENTPLYFRDFVRQVRACDLDYLGEAELANMMTIGLPDDIEEVLGRVSGDLVRTQQYLDFLLNRAFRHSLVVHADVDPQQILHSDRVPTLALASPLRRPGDAPVPLEPGVEITFSGDGRDLTTDAPDIKAGWVVLQNAYPSALDFDAWVAATAEVLGVQPDAELAGSLASNALYAYAQQLVEFWPDAMDLQGHTAERPRAFAYARLQALAGSPWVTTRRHSGYRVDELDRRVLAWSDGTHTRQQIIEGIADEVRRGDLILEDEDGQPTLEEALEAVTEVLPGRLFALGRVGALDPVPEPEGAP